MQQCFVCGRSQTVLGYSSCQALSDPGCSLLLCEACQPQLKTKKYQPCHGCKREFRHHDWRNRWVRRHCEEVKLREQLRDKLSRKEERLGQGEQAQRYLLLLELLIHLRREGAQPEVEDRVKQAIIVFLRQKQQSQNVVRLQGNESQTALRPKFIREVDNPISWGAQASGYSVEDCFKRGIQMIRRAIKKW